MKYLFPILFAALALSQQAGATNFSGLISSNTVFTKANSPYIINGNVLVKDGATLYIEPGVEVRFDWLDFDIEGSIRALGTSTEPIVFKTNGAGVMPGNRWKGLMIRAVGALDSIIFDHCKFENAAYCLRAGGGRISITNSTITNCVSATDITSQDGFYIGNNIIKHCEFGLGVTGKGIVEGNEIAHIGDEAIQCYQQVSLKGNYVHDCAKGIHWGGGPLQSDCEVTNNTVVNVQGVGMHIHSGKILGGVYGNVSAYNGTGYYIGALNNPVQYNTAIGNETGLKIATNSANFLFRNNCILNSSGYAAIILGDKYDHIDITLNYWGTSDSAVLESKMYDFTDSFNYPTGHILPVLSQPDIGCKQYTGPIETNIPETKNTTAPITLSPNPFTNNFSIDLQGRATRVEVFNMAGQKLVSLDAGGKNKMEVDMAAYPAGVYHYRVQMTDHTTATGKLIKQ